MLPLELLRAARVNAVMATMQDVRLLPGDLLWSGRIPDVDALDSEIMASFTGYVVISDLIADDGKAVTYQNLKMNYDATAVPNIKHGFHMTQETLMQLATLFAGGGSQFPEFLRSFEGWENRIIDSLLLGIRQRKEALFVAMLTDSYSYDRLGIKMTNVTWGMPADLKVTPAVPWTDAVNATPITDLLTVKQRAQVRYGIMLNRVTMSLSAFQLMIATNDFKNRVAFVLGPNLSAAILPTQNNDYMRNLAQNILGMEIEFYDSRYWTQSESGALVSEPYLSINKVVMTDSGNDGRQGAWDFANGIVTESIVGTLAAGAGTNMIGSLGGIQRGPVAYATIPQDLNPPNITYWGVARGFPRKHLKQASAVLTVGTFSDGIAVGPPY